MYASFSKGCASISTEETKSIVDAIVGVKQMTPKSPTQSWRFGKGHSPTGFSSSQNDGAQSGSRALRRPMLGRAGQHRWRKVATPPRQQARHHPSPRAPPLQTGRDQLGVY